MTKMEQLKAAYAKVNPEHPEHYDNAEYDFGVLAYENFDLLCRYDPETQIAIIWSIEDVKAGSPGLSDAQAMEVLKRVKQDHNAEWGICWDTLDYAAEDMYPEEKLK